MIDLLSFFLGLAAAGIFLAVALPLLTSKAWWLGIHDYKNRFFDGCHKPCWECEIWARCLVHKPVEVTESE